MSQQKPNAARARPRRATVQRKATLAKTKDAQAPLPALPAPDDREGWETYWKERKLPWRREPEIDAQRQEELAQRRASAPDVEQGTYPFSGIRLTRADIEWLLVTHEHGRGPVEWSDASQRARRGLDVRGTDLHELNLAGLPLAGLIGGLDSVPVWSIPDEQTRLAGVILTRADLSEAQLEGAILSEAQLERADLIGAQLQGAELIRTQLEGAILPFAQLEGADLSEAQLEGAILFRAHLERADLEGVILAGPQGIGPQLVDVRWDGTNLAVVDWSQVNILGDEEVAQRTTDRDGQRKEKRQRLDEG